MDLDDLRAHRVAQRDAHELVVGALLVDHAEDGHRPDADPAAREGRVADEDERVEGVAVLAERPFDEAVVGGVNGRGEEAPVKDDRVELRGPANRQVVLPS